MSLVRVLAACCLCASLATVVAAADPVLTSGADLAATNRMSREAELKLLQALQKKITVEWTDVPLEDVLKRIAEDTSMNVVIDRAGVGGKGVNLDYQVTLHLGETAVCQALLFLLQPLELIWVGQDGVLVITTNELNETGNQPFVRMYDVSAIVKVLESQLEN